MDTRQPGAGQTRTTTIAAARVERTARRTISTLLVIAVTEHGDTGHDDCDADANDAAQLALDVTTPPTRSTLRGAVLAGPARALSAGTLDADNDCDDAGDDRRAA